MDDRQYIKELESRCEQAVKKIERLKRQHEYSGTQACMDRIESLTAEVSDLKRLVNSICSTKPDDYSEDFFELLAIRDMISKFDQKSASVSGSQDPNADLIGGGPEAITNYELQRDFADSSQAMDPLCQVCEKRVSVIEVAALKDNKPICNECFYKEITDDSRQKPRGLPMERRLESKCDHEMETTGSGTYCLKPYCDVNWT